MPFLPPRRYTSAFMSAEKTETGWPPPEVDFETLSPMRRALKRALINPLANYLPAGCVRALLRAAKSELAAANWADPGGWRSMVLSYDGRARQIADRILINAGTMAMALRNRKRLGSFLIARLIDSAGSGPVHVVCLGAGPGQIIIDALARSNPTARASLVDHSADAFAFGRELADRSGLGDRVRYIQADVRAFQEFLDGPADAVTMLGICEYLGDEHIVSTARAAADVMPDNAPIVFNSLSFAHGTDRFFRRVFGLHMIHRGPEQMKQLMSEAGFGEFRAHGEPLGVYHVIVGRKLAVAGGG